MVKIGNIELPDFPLLLAPMEDVSDPPFRALCKEQGADVVYTEFVSSEGLIRNAAKSVMKLDIYENERPVGIQIFGSNLESMLQTIDIVEKSSKQGRWCGDFKRYMLNGTAHCRNGQANKASYNR